MEKKVVNTAMLAAALIVLACVALVLVMGLTAADAANSSEAFYGNETAVVSYENNDTVYAVVSSAEGTDTDEQPAAEETSDNTDVAKAIGAGIAIAIATAAGAISMGLAICKTNESIARQPEMEGKLRSSMMLGLVFIETVMIYALVMGILIVFVL